MRNDPKMQTLHFHAVQFYQDPASLAAMVARFLSEGFDRGDAGVVIATGAHQTLIEEELSSLDVDVDGLKRLGELVTLDAVETLEQFMADGMPDPRSFETVLGRALDDVSKPTPESTIRAYGEMVDVLWQDGRQAAAIRLEMLWNTLANTRDFRLLCGYSMGSFFKAAAIDAIKAQHSHVFDDKPLRLTAPPSRMGSIV